MRTSSSFVAAFLLAAAAANAESISPGATYSQDFDSLGNSATASLPSGWSATASTSIQAVTATEWGNAVTATEKQGTGTGTTAGIYNWGDAGNASDRGVGFLASGSAAKTGNLYLSLTATGYIPSFMVSYDMKCYRNNTRQYRFQLYYSTDGGTSWTSAGNDFCTSNIVASSGAVVNPAGVTSVSSKPLNVSLASGETVILCWSYSVSSGTETSNAQGLGIDNVVIVAGQSSGPDPLSAPTFEPVYPEDATADGFVLRWPPVENAVAYELSVTNAATGMEAGASVSFSIPSGPDPDYVVATVSDLDPDTTYEVAARALATTDPSFPSLDHSDSDWSAPVEITTTLEGGLLRATLFDETFDRAGGNSWNRGSTTFDASLTDESGWVVATIRRGPEGLLLGTENNTGSATTREIAVSNGIENATVVISFLAASYAGKTTSGTLTASNTVTSAETVLLNLAPNSMSNSTTEPLAEGTFYEFEATVPARFSLRFESLASAKDHRLLLDSIKVTQVYDPNYAALAAPTGVAGSDIGKYGFTVSWNAVSNATGYAVWLNGAFEDSCASTDTSMQLTGLSDGTAYSVQVRALGDNLHVGDSPLSTAVTVTTLEDAQKIDFTVTGAPAGDVFAGDSVSFTVTATNEGTHAAEPVSFSNNIAGATFSNGTFSWTPAESDVGTNVATFTSGMYSTNVAITVVSAFETETLETENFSQIKSTSWTSTTGYTNRIDGDIGTWTGTDIIKTKSAVIIGRRTSSGTIVSPAVELKARTPGSFSVSFDTGSVPGAKASVRAQILDASNDAVLYTTNFPTVAALSSDATAVSDAGARFTVAPGPSVVLPAAVKVAFTTYESAGDDSQRAYVDTVVFQQTISARIRDLPAPTGLAVVGNPGESGFTFGWTAVTDATNYAVRVTDAGGAVVFSAPFSAATQATVSGLSDDVSYAVQVRATGDETVWYASPWSDALAVRTARSSTHPTLTLGAWQNAVGDGKVYGGLLNTAAVSAVRDNGSNAVVTLTSVQPAPVAGPTLEGCVLSWIPADADTNKTFTISFLMDGTYATNVSYKVFSIAALAPPTVTVAEPVAWNAIDLSWNAQYRAAGYSVRVWTDCPNPGATATRVEEDFAGWPTAKPSWWAYHNLAGSYKDAHAPVAFNATGDELKTYDLGGTISSVSFHAAGHSISNSTSTLTVVGIGADNTETVLATLTAADIGQTAAGIDRTLSVPAGTVVRKIAWRYTKDKGGVGVGSVVIEGTGFSTARFLPGWGPVAKDIGLVQSYTVAKPRPGKVLGVDPTDKKKDLTEPRPNYAEVTVRDAAGATLATVVEVDVPAPPRSVRATMLILR